MENNNSFFDLILTAAFFYVLFLTPIGWVAIIVYIMIHLHPVYWLYRIVRAIEKN